VSTRRFLKGGSEELSRELDGRISAFEVKDCDLAGRTGALKVGSREVMTPALMPVVNPNLLEKGYPLTPFRLKEEFGFDIMITNSYMIRKNPDLSSRALELGLHRLLDFDGIIMTDSGTFQSYVYGGGGKNEVDVDPLEIVEFQRNIGSDIGTILDRFTTPDTDRQRADSDLRETMSRGSLSLEKKGQMELAVPVQGGLHLDLREEAGRLVREMGVRYSPIGGVVPLMESYRYAELVDVIISAKKGLGPSIPAHLFGAGHPMFIPLAVALGCDLFDSASYAKFAKDGRYLTMDRTRHLREMESFPCSCRTCSRMEPKEMLELPPLEREALLAEHNLWSLRAVMGEVRSAIREGTLWELVERSASFHPSLYEAVRHLGDRADFLEDNAPATTRRFMCSDLNLGICRPEFRRYRRSLCKNYRYPDADEMVLVKGTSGLRGTVGSRKLHSSFGRGSWVVVTTPIGPVPSELLDMYPPGQSVLPPIDSLPGEIRNEVENHVKAFSEGWAGPVRSADADSLSDDAVEKAPSGLDLHRIINVSRMQFGRETDLEIDRVLLGEYSDLSLLKERVVLRTSRRTGKVRNVLAVDGDKEEHILSLRAEDGHFTLKLAGGARLHHAGWPYRVTVDSETGEYNAMGYNVFCRFVLSAGECIRPGDEVLVVDPSGSLLAVGQARITGRHMVEGDSGVAVKVREGIKGK